MRACIGPPGTGKTSWLKDRVHEALADTGPLSVFVTSMTREAAAVAASRVSLPEGYVSTLHSYMYHHLQLGSDRVWESVRGAWNEENDHWAIGPRDSRGTYMYADIERQRGLRELKLEGEMSDFYEAYCVFKRDCGVLDFTDMIERGLNMAEAPFSVLQVFGDEAQDFSQLEADLLRHWDTLCSVTVCGDDDQRLFDFRGIGARSILHDDPNPTVLRQSYRVPVRAHRIARAVVARISDRIDQPYEPTSDEGIVEHLGMVTPEAVLAIVERTPGTWLIIAPTRYPLRPLIRTFRDAGLPFGRAEPGVGGVREEWNPLLAKEVSQYKTTFEHDEYARRVDDLYGWEGLTEPPRVNFGTIHSVKGGEADNVMLITNMTDRVSRSLRTFDERDSVHRMMYVGVTRTKSRLFIGEISNDESYPLPA